ncbi:MAG: cobalamin biosynthesis protein CobN [Thermoprotei archaeon]|nr:MAG: cobalamin biosynthesis protein CobN [Thermoprotei archaeon]
MKMAVVGKGGVGKTTIAGTLARLLARDGFNVIAVDADPSLNLSSALGIPQEIAMNLRPLAENVKLMRSRVQVGFGGLLNLTPKVDDIVDKFGVIGPDGVKLLVMGTVRSGGSGCLCPENAFLRALMSHLLLGRKDVVIMDMVAGLEHLGRGTARGVDLMLCVVEPSVKALETARRVMELSRDIGVKNVAAVANKILSEKDVEYVKEGLSSIGLELLGLIPFDEAVIEADRRGKALLDYAPKSLAVRSIKDLEKKVLKRYLE